MVELVFLASMVLMGKCVPYAVIRDISKSSSLALSKTLALSRQSVFRVDYMLWLHVLECRTHKISNGSAQLALEWFHRTVERLFTAPSEQLVLSVLRIDFHR